MKQLRMIPIILASVFLSVGYVNQVAAQAFPQEPWKIVSHCGPGQIEPNDLDVVTKRNNRTDLKKEDLVRLLTKGPSYYCGQGNNFEINGWGDDFVYYCGPGWVTGRDRSGDAVWEGIVPFGNPICCPISHPNTTATNMDVCCEQGFWPDFSGWSNKCSGGTRETPIAAPKDPIASAGDPIAPSSGATYMCPLDGCLTDAADNIVENKTNITPLSIHTVNGRKCYPRSTTNNPVIKPGSNPPLHCQGGEWVSEDELTFDNDRVVANCALIFDENERDNCFECFAKNPDPNSDEPQTYVYSSLGCIDTRQNPFITRLFQTGFGLLGGFAIIMIMWGSVQRQSTDPAKIQEGWDKIKAAIASLIMIASAFPLLRYLGINLTGLLPFDIFN